MNQIDIEKRTLTIRRTFDAPRSLVWAAWTKAEHIGRWWSPPGMQTTIVQHDFREGGAWEYTMAMPDGKKFIAHGVYARIIAPELIETSANFIPMTEGVTMRIVLEEDGARTEFIFKVIHPTEAYRKQQEDMGFFNGWGSAFDRLQKIVSEPS